MVGREQVGGRELFIHLQRENKKKKVVVEKVRWYRYRKGVQ